MYAISNNFLLHILNFMKLFSTYWTATEQKLFLFSVIARGKSYFEYKYRITSSLLLVMYFSFFFLFQMNRELFINDFFKITSTQNGFNFWRMCTGINRWAQYQLVWDSMAGSLKDLMLQKPFLQINYKAILLFFLRLASPTDPNFWHLQKRRKKKKATT